MFSNTALDVFIGLVFIFLLYSLLATIVQEMIAVRLAFRSKVLEKALLRMLEDTVPGRVVIDTKYKNKAITLRPFVDRINGVRHLFGLKDLMKGKCVTPWFYAHPLIKYLAEDNYYSKPAYLDAANFSKVMIDLLKGIDQPGAIAVQAIHNSIKNGTIYKLDIDLSKDTPDKNNPAVTVLRDQYGAHAEGIVPESPTVSMNQSTALFLRSLWQDAGADVDVFRQKLERWFDDTMERATGWYKRYTQFVLFIIGMIVAYSFNVDTIAIHRILSKDKNAREQLVKMAIREKDNLGAVANSLPANDSLLNDAYNKVADDANAANLIIGLGKPWKDSICDCTTYFEDSTKTAAFTTKLDSFISVKDSIALLVSYRKVPLLSLSKAIDSLGKELDSLKVARADSLPIITDLTMLNDSKKRFRDISVGGDTLALNDSIRRMQVKAARCPEILRQTTGKWFVYSPRQNGGWETLFGWLITAIAISLGAPFWFDLLNKLIKLRGTGTKVTASDDSSNSSSTSGSSPTAPVSVNVNTNPGEEAVG